MSEQTCKRCGNIYPMTAKHFPKERRNTSGLSGTCRPCTRALNEVSRAILAASRFIEKQPETEKVCRACKKTFPLNSAYFQQYQGHNGTYWRSLCYACYKAYCKAYRQRNQKTRNAHNRDYEKRKKLERFQQIIKG